MNDGLTREQRARQFPCSCGAGPGENCRTKAGKQAYHVHVDRMNQENDAWHEVQERNARL
jgi:hypothetical protein